MKFMIYTEMKSTRVPGTFKMQQNKITNTR